MMKILTLGNEVLREKAAAVPDIDDEIRQLTGDMLQSMYRGKGIGLAAPQVGDLRRIFVVHVGEDIPRVFINPEIMETSFERADLEEGCLSIPGVYADMLRPAAVKVQAWNERGRPFTLDADGILSRVIQHELDHLNGVLFIDRLSEEDRENVLKQYRMLRKKKSKVRS